MTTVRQLLDEKGHNVITVGSDDTSVWRRTLQNGARKTSVH